MRCFPLKARHTGFYDPPGRSSASGPRGSPPGSSRRSSASPAAIHCGTPFAASKTRTSAVDRRSPAPFARQSSSESRLAPRLSLFRPAWAAGWTTRYSAALTLRVAWGSSAADQEPPKPPDTSDLYLPEKAPGPLPVVAWVQGGGWEEGDKDWRRAVLLLEGADHLFQRRFQKVALRGWEGVVAGAR